MSFGTCGFDSRGEHHARLAQPGRRAAFRTPCPSRPPGSSPGAGTQQRVVGERPPRLAWDEEILGSNPGYPTPPAPSAGTTGPWRNRSAQRPDEAKAGGSSPPGPTTPRPPLGGHSSMAQWQRARWLPARFQVRVLVGELDGASMPRRTKRVSGDASGLISLPVHVRLVAPLPVPPQGPAPPAAEHCHVLLDDTGRR